MIETEKLLKAILLQVKLANTLDDAVIMVENLCEKDWIAEADQSVEKIRANQRKGAN